MKDMLTAAAGIFVIVQTLKNIQGVKDSPLLKIAVIVVLATGASRWGFSTRPSSWEIMSTAAGTTGLAILMHRIYVILQNTGDALLAYIATSRRR